MEFGRWALLDRLASRGRVLIAGAGGGFDVFCGLPLYFALRQSGKQVDLANLSFTDLSATDGRRIGEVMFEVVADTHGPVDYFPEKHLCDWFHSQGERVATYCCARSGVVPLRQSYSLLQREKNYDAVVLVDGGTDSLMRGDEFNLATPHEDVASIAAIDALEGIPAESKLLVCSAFGVDAYHGICHAQFLEGVAELDRAGGYLGVLSLHRGAPEVQRYIEAYDFVEAAMGRASIVNASMISAVEGFYGDHHRSRRTAGSRLWINPLMSLYWGFELGAVARRLLYLDRIAKTKTYAQLDRVIAEFRAEVRAKGQHRDFERIEV